MRGSVLYGWPRAGPLRDGVGPPDIHFPSSVAVPPGSVPPAFRVLQVTGTTVMRDTGAALETMRALRKLGVRLSIDDFGTGHSSLAQLRSLPVDEIKIDKSFILALGSSQDDAVIVRSAIEIGHNMGLSVIAEGVEDARSLAILRGLRCDMVQGYLFSPPLPAAEFVAWHAGYSQSEVVA